MYTNVIGPVYDIPCDFIFFLVPARACSKKLKSLGFPSQFTKSTKVLMATTQGRRLGYHTPEQVLIQEPPDSRRCVLTTALLGGGANAIQGRLKSRPDPHLQVARSQIRNNR